MTLSRRIFATGALAVVALAGLAAMPASAASPADVSGKNCHGGKSNELLLICDAPKGKYLPKASNDYHWRDHQKTSDDYRWRDDKKASDDYRWRDNKKASDDYRWRDDRKVPGWASNGPNHDRRYDPYPRKGQVTPY